MDPQDSRPEIRLLDEAKIQARVLVPVLRALRKELGRPRADELVSVALREWSRELFEDIAAAIPGSAQQKWRGMMDASFPRIAGDIDVDLTKQDEQGMDFNVTGCRYADFFRQLGEPELGAVLLCESDVHMVDAVGSGVDFQRSQTIMRGGSHCDFRYRFERSDDSE